MSALKRSLTPGIILVLIGGLLLLHHWFPFVLNWAAFLIILGIVFILLGISRRDHGAVFPGTFLFLIGLLFYLKSQGLIYLPWWQIWPLFALFLGVAFLALCVFDPQRRYAFFPGIFLVALAFLLLLFPWSWDKIFYWISKLWPVILIIIGLRLLWKAKNKE